MVSRFEQIDYIKYDTYLFVNLVLVLTRKAVLFALDLSLSLTLLTSSLGSSANKISYFVRTRLNWNKQIRIITLFVLSYFSHFLMERFDIIWNEINSSWIRQKKAKLFRIFLLDFLSNEHYLQRKMITWPNFTWPNQLIESF